VKSELLGIGVPATGPEISCSASKTATVAVNADRAGFAAMVMSGGFAVSYTRGDEVLVRPIGDVQTRSTEPADLEDPNARQDAWSFRGAPSELRLGEEDVSGVRAVGLGLPKKRLVVAWREGQSMRARLYDSFLLPAGDLVRVDGDVEQVDVAARGGRILVAALVRTPRGYDVVASTQTCTVD
jgi:hypothetical protein